MGFVPSEPYLGPPKVLSLSFFKACCYNDNFALNGIGTSVAYAEGVERQGGTTVRFTFVDGGVTSSDPELCNPLCGGYWLPAPATIPLLGLGLVGIGVARRKRA